MAHWSLFIKTIFAYVSKIVPTKGERIARFRLDGGTCVMRSPLVGTIFETHAKMVLTNDDQCAIADIVLDVWLFEKKFNHPSTDYTKHFHMEFLQYLLQN